MSAVNAWLGSMAQSCHRCHAEDQLVAWAMDEGLATIPGTTFEPQGDAAALLFEIEALR